MKNKKTLNITIDAALWDSLCKFASQQTLAQGRRVSTISMLRIAVRVFLRMTPSEINSILQRTDNAG